MRRKIQKPKPRARGGASLRYNTQIRDLVRKFYKKLPNEELAQMVTRLTGEACEPDYIRYLARPAQMSEYVKRPRRNAPGRAPVANATDIESREAGKASLEKAQNEAGCAIDGA